MSLQDDLTRGYYATTARRGHAPSRAHYDTCADGLLRRLRAWLPEALKHFPGYMHLVGNLSFAIDGDTATGKVACFNPMVVPGADTMFLGLWYLDRYVRTADGWRIRERVERKSYDFNIPPALKARMSSP